MNNSKRVESVTTIPDQVGVIRVMAKGSATIILETRASELAIRVSGSVTRIRVIATGTATTTSGRVRMGSRGMQ